MTLDSARATFEVRLETGARAVRFDLDPGFELFRRLYAEEMPLSFSKVFAEEREITISLPAAERAAYQRWVDAIRALLPAAQAGANVRVITDAESAPAYGALWILGPRNRHALAASASWSGHGISLADGRLDFQGRSWAARDGAVFLAERIGGVPALWAWAEAELPAQILVAKILHYSGFSFSGFVAEKNTFKAEWPVDVSPLTRVF